MRICQNDSLGKGRPNTSPCSREQNGFPSHMIFHECGITDDFLHGQNVIPSVV